jgi:hypothetical protein
MQTSRGFLRGIVLSPALAEATFAGPEFPSGPSVAREPLASVPRPVICGFGPGAGPPPGPGGAAGPT